MSFLMRQVAHCDVCGHEWLTKKVPTHCAKCKSRKWNQGQSVAEVRKFDTPAYEPSATLPVKNMELQRKICAEPVRSKHAKTCKCLMCKPPKSSKRSSQRS